MNEEQQKLFDDNVGLAYVAIKRFCKYKGNIQFRLDIRGLAFLGLALATQRYSEDKSSFSTFAHHTINGTIQNGLRRLKGLKKTRHGDYYHEFRIHSNYEDPELEKRIFDITFAPNSNYVDDYDTIDNLFDPLGERGKMVAIEHFLNDYTQKEIAKKFKIKVQDVSRYINRAKDLAEEYYGMTSKRKSTKAMVYKCFGEYLTIKQIIEKYGVKCTLLRGRLERGWSVEDAILKPQMTA